MNLSEATDLLEKRLGWKEDKTIEGFALNADNLITESGLYFQDEHSAITLLNIMECQPIASILDSDFNIFLSDLRKSTVRQVLNDALEKDYLDDDIFNLYSSGFDKAISLKMTIKVSELILTGIRSNRTQRLNEAFVGKLNYDVFRESPNKFAVSRLNYQHTMGISTKYAYELSSVQRRFGQQRNLLRTITKGEAFDGKSYTR